jgi:hypothetical protein
LMMRRPPAAVPAAAGEVAVTPPVGGIEE